MKYTNTGREKKKENNVKSLFKLWNSLKKELLQTLNKHMQAILCTNHPTLTKFQKSPWKLDVQKSLFSNIEGL